MKLAMPTKRYKGFTRIEESARDQIESILRGCSPLFATLDEVVQRRLIETLRPEAQNTLLHALEGRTLEQEELSGFDWKDTLAGMASTPVRQQAVQLIAQEMPELARTLDQPEVVQGDVIEWLYEETAGRIARFTPYLTQEEEAVARWKEECPEAYALAEAAARRGSTSFQDRSRKEKTAPPRVTDEARELSFLAHLIAARKLHHLAWGVTEYFEKDAQVISLKAPPDLQGALGNRAYVRLGTNGRPPQYREPTAPQMEVYRRMLDSSMLLALQQKVCPWTANNNVTRRIDCNLLAKVYWGSVRPNATEPPDAIPHQPTLQALGGSLERYRLLGFREDIAPEHAAILDEFWGQNQSLQEFLGKPSTRAAFKAHRLNKSIVQLGLNAACAQELVRVGCQWNPSPEIDTRSVLERAHALVPLVVKDLAEYHDRLMETDYLALRQQNFFKEMLAREHLTRVSPKDRAKLESYYRPMAVVLVARNDGYAGSIPRDWKAIRTYEDSVSGAPFTDYSLSHDGQNAIICLQRGADPHRAVEAVKQLLDLEQPPWINDGGIRTKGVRLSELSFNELSASCLRPRTIARMQFYTSFWPEETLNLLRGTSDEPTTENLIEAMRPCFILRYSDAYARVKPAEMIRVKYRTPIGEKKNPCWDASRILGGLRENDVRYRERLENPDWSLVMIEGEKKAALLAQMFIEKDLPYHVVALPGVWMGLDRQRNLVEEIGRFQMQAGGHRRDCFIFFDNDKAYKAGVTDAMLALAKALQKAGANVFIPNLPFGRNVKGADDFAMVHCMLGNDIDYQPLLDIINTASNVPEKVRSVKYPTAEQEQEINQHLGEAERIQELQEKIAQSAHPLKEPEFCELWTLQEAYRGKSLPETEAIANLENLTPAGRSNLLQRLLSENRALELLREACRQIPRFEDGPSPRSLSPAASQDRIEAQALMELYA